MTSQQINAAMRTAYASKGYDKTIKALDALLIAGKILPADRLQAIECLNFMRYGAKVYP